MDTSNITVNAHGGIDGVRANVNGYSRDFKMGQIDAWTLSVQRQLQGDLLVELNYSGTAAHHLPVWTTTALTASTGT